MLFIAFSDKSNTAAAFMQSMMPLNIPESRHAVSALIRAPGNTGERIKNNKQSSSRFPEKIIAGNDSVIAPSYNA